MSLADVISRFVKPRERFYYARAWHGDTQPTADVIEETWNMNARLVSYYPVPDDIHQPKFGPIMVSIVVFEEYATVNSADDPITARTRPLGAIKFHIWPVNPPKAGIMGTNEYPIIRVCEDVVELYTTTTGSLDTSKQEPFARMNVPLMDKHPYGVEKRHLHMAFTWQDRHDWQKQVEEDNCL